MRHVVGVSDMKVSGDPEDTIITHALGSCIGISIYDPHQKVGGLLHFQLPSSVKDPEKAERNPFMFADTGIPIFFREAYKLGAVKHRLVVKVAGGGKPNRGNDMFEIGKRNYIYMRKMFWKNNIMIASEYVGGTEPITMWIELETGKTLMRIRGEITEL